MKQIGLVVCILVCTLMSGAQGFLKVQGKNIVDGKEKDVVLRGMGLGGWMLQEPYMLQLSGVAGRQGQIREKIQALIGAERTRQFYDAWLSNHTTRADIDSLKAWGFNSVRLPMHYNLFTPPVEEEPVQGQNTWIEKGFRMTDSLLAWCSANQIYLILDLHAAPGGQGKDFAISDYDNTKPSLWESRAAQEKTIALWRRLAGRYAREPWIGGYDLINETNWGFTDTADKNGCNEKLNAPLKKLLMEITSAIRTVDTNHIIFIEANCWANNYSGMFPLWDKNMVVSFHKYWNYNNRESLQNMLSIREQQNVPLWLGESGENSNVWFRDAVALLESNHIGWAWWPLKKLGGNNPLQVPLDSGYAQLLRFWRTQGAAPAPEEAIRALMQFAANTHIRNNIVHRDVIDAMFRQVRTDETLPFQKNRIGNNSILYAVDYDLGRNGFAYFDLDTANYWVSNGKHTDGNRGRVYRNDGVDIERCSDKTTNGYQVAADSTEWLRYTLDVATTGLYNIVLRARAKDSTATIRMWLNDHFITIQPLAGGGLWEEIVWPAIPMGKGKNRLRIDVRQGAADLNYIQFQKVRK